MTVGTQLSIDSRYSYYSPAVPLALLQALRRGQFVRLALLCALAFLCVAASSAQAGAAPGTIPHIAPAEAPVIDGEMAPGEWDDRVSSSGFFDSSLGTPAPREGKFWLTSDGEFIYFAARLQADPRRLSADAFRANVSLWGNDHVSLQVDPFGTTTSWNEFGVNPRGATSLEIDGGRAAKMEWIGEFTARGSLLEDGWQVEARIPWKLMTLGQSGTRDLRFNVSWYDSQSQQRLVWQFTHGDPNRIGRWQAVPVPHVEVERSIKLLPYLYVGLDHNDEAIVNAGLDFKTEIDRQIQLVGTILPDFRNIEQQVLSLDFSYFERLADEARPFFQEGEQFRRTGFDHRLFASQRIDTFDTGLNVYGNLGGQTQFGALATLDFGEAAATVASVTHQLDQDSSLGLSYVGWDSEGENNRAFQFSGGRRFGTWDFFTSRQQTDDDILGSGYRQNFGFMHDAGGFEAFVNYLAISENFFPRIGFAPERNLKGFSGSVEWERIHPRGAVLETGLDVYFADYDRYTGGDYRQSLGLSSSIAFRDGTDLDIGMGWEQFLEYDDRTFSVSLENPRRHPTRRWMVEGEWGLRRERAYRSLELGFLYRPLPRLQTDFRVQSVRHIRNREQLVASFNYDLGPLESFGGRVVRHDRDWNWFLTYRRSGGRGSELFFILGNPNSDSFERTMILKLNYPLDIRF